MSRNTKSEQTRQLIESSNEYAKRIAADYQELNNEAWKEKYQISKLSIQATLEKKGLIKVNHISQKEKPLNEAYTSSQGQFNPSLKKLNVKQKTIYVQDSTWQRLEQFCKEYDGLPKPNIIDAVINYALDNINK